MAALAQFSTDCRPLAKGVVSDCGKSNDVFQFSDIVLTPEAPTWNATNYIRIQGTLKETLTYGTYVNVTILQGGKQHDDNKDLCAMLDQLRTQKRCPVSPQDIAFVNSLDITSYFPTGNYKIKVIGFTNTSRQLFNFRIDATI
ncbi:hypothetical protein DSO57_1020896 [Entomophthora muscae]|uniref:Uncharacterized protein n=1 Tax=Entomophthora muscae TaxID=34485 RepID=A0ACC2TR17_9FUNG|nr:hypothetical protein DSO57_1020896 [Entomophthora muscae]